MATDDGGPAFPLTGDTYGNNGMSLRNYFAAQALAGLICLDAEPDETAKWAVAYAKALINELNKEQTDADLT